MKTSTSLLVSVACASLFSIPALCQQQEISPASTDHAAASSEHPPISTDRPSIGTGPDLVPVGSTQIENGIGWTRHDGFDGTESLVRFGLFKRVELQLTSPNMHWSGQLPGVHSDDMSLGTKLQVGSENWKWPVALVSSVSLPIGSKENSSGGFDPSLLLGISHGFSHGLQLVSSASLVSVSSPVLGRSVHSQIASFVTRCVTRKACAFAEIAPFFGSAADTSGYTMDAGMTWAVKPLLQLDWRAGTTQQTDGRTVFLGVGYSFRRDR